MKYFATIMIILGSILLAAVLVPQPADANVYAAQLAIANPDGSPFDGDFSDGSGAQFSFFLNDTATTVTVEVVDAESGEVVAQIEVEDRSRGLNTVDWDGSGALASHRYIFRLTAQQPTPSSTDWTMFYDSGDINIFTRGVAVVTDPTDPRFGLILTCNDAGPLGTGINIFNPDGSFHDPFLVAADQSSGGTINYGTDAPLFAVLDEEGRLYVSLKDLGQIMRIFPDYSTQILIDGLTFPKGLYVEGSGDEFTLYVAANDQILRADVGTAETFEAANMEVVGQFSGFFPHQIILDDDGALYTSLRDDNDLGSDGRGIRKYDLSGTLPVTDDDAVWFMMEDRTFIANDLMMDRGEDPNTSVDDILYFVTRAGSNDDRDGIWRINDINTIFPDTVRIITEEAFYGVDDNVQARATMDFDPAGNIVFMENANEHVFFISPPSVDPFNSYTTTSQDTFTVDLSVGIADAAGPLPQRYYLEANYPNPFNPSTTIRYRLGKAGATTLTVYNSLGETVRTLVNRQQAAGEYSVTWNGRNEAGQAVSSGVYILTLQSGEFRQSRRMTLVR